MGSTRAAKSQDAARYVRVIRSGVSETPDRVAGYREALLDHVIEIINLERANAERRMNITQRVAAQAEALGGFLLSHQWTPGAEIDS